MLIFQVIFGFVAAVLLSIGGYLYFDRVEFLENADRTIGKVVDFEKRTQKSSPGRDLASYAPIVEFTTEKGNKIRFTNSASEGVVELERGDEIPLYYLRSDPDHALIDTFMSKWGGTTIVTGIGSLFGFVWLILATVSVLPVLRKRKLLNHGVRVTGEVREVQTETHISVGGKHPLRLIARCRHPQSGEELHLKSQRILEDISSSIVGKEVEIYLDVRKPTRNFFKLEGSVGGAP